MTSGQFNLKKRIIEHFADLASSKRVDSIVFGDYYSAVGIDGNVGLAYSFRCSGDEFIRDNRLDDIDKLSPNALLDMALSDSLSAQVIGIAAANALSNVESDEFFPGDVRKLLDLNSDDVVGFVGNFKPLQRDVESAVKKLYIFEKRTDCDDGLHDAGKIPEILPECSVAVITASSIIDGAMDNILQHCQNCREVVILGATTPLIKEVFQTTPVTMLSGVVVKDAKRLVECIKQGGGMRDFGNMIEKVNLRIK